ncbi:MAG: response regulator [Desulfomonilaceae bacterium]|nr:response regulator [Desulfomonilaceae bacterium]
MSDPEILIGKKILAVDDEPDVLEIIRDQLGTSDIVTAGNFQSAYDLIKSETFDLIILDIMGVNGFALLEAAKKRKMPAAMLTAHAVNVESINLAIRGGAVSFLPKEELTRLPELVSEIFEELAKGRSHWDKLFQRLGPYFRKRLVLDFEDLEKPPYPPFRY